MSSSAKRKRKAESFVYKSRMFTDNFSLWSGLLSKGKAVLKGGTLLRIAAMQDFRNSEDFYIFLNEVLDKISENTDMSFHVHQKGSISDTDTNLPIFGVY